MSKKYEEIFRQMEREMERLTHDALEQFDRVRSRARIWQPRADVCETEDAVVVTVEVAGLSAEALSRRINITLTPDGRTLMISGRRQEPASDGKARVRCFQLEIYYGEFERSLPMPSDVTVDRESITANYRDGFLTITLPKKSSPPPRTIPVDAE